MQKQREQKQREQQQQRRQRPGMRPSVIISSIVAALLFLAAGIGVVVSGGGDAAIVVAMAGTPLPSGQRAVALRPLKEWFKAPTFRARNGPTGGSLLVQQEVGIFRLKRLVARGETLHIPLGHGDTAIVTGGRRVKLVRR